VLLVALMGVSTAATPAAAAGGLSCRGDARVSLLDLEPRPLFGLRYASPCNFLGATL